MAKIGIYEKFAKM